MIIGMENVSWKRENKWVLQNINWEVKQGENWAVLGLNGSGKTTLLNIVNGYIFPSSGKVNVLGNIFGKSDLRELRRSIGWVSSSLQEDLYLNETALEIVLSGKFATIGLVDTPSPADIAAAQKLLAGLGCTPLQHRPYRSLSQGEKQKVMIARSLISSPELLILDEPCTGLDILAKERLLSTVQLLAEGQQAPALIYVTHHTDEILPVFKNVLLLKDGQIHSAGKKKHILTARNLKDFFGVPIELSWENERPVLRMATEGLSQAAL
ncbi:MAG: ABC transporter ATP-binding protein [Peptococcaceae bacterium]